jgi:fructose-1,6-bisphosphatase/inositol monophosphatase family enzyme
MAPIPAGPVEKFQLVSYGDALLRRFPDGKFPGKMRMSGAFVVDGTFTALQRFRGLIGHRERLYDVAACVLINQELGADIRYADGSSFELTPLQSPAAIEPWIIFPANSGFNLT